MYAEPHAEEAPAQADIAPAVALIAHDARKAELLELVRAFREDLADERLVATGTTGRMLAERAGLDVECVASGPLGGDLQIGAQVAAGEVKLVIFLRDPLNAHPHESDIQALFKVCDAHRVPLATNVNSAALCLLALTRDAESRPRSAALVRPPVPRQRRRGSGSQR